VPDKGLTGRIIHSLAGERDDLPKTLSRTEASAWVWSVHILLFVLTVLTTTAFGNGLVASFAAGRSFDEDIYLASILHLVHGDVSLWKGLIYSVPLLLILMAHEMGHYLTCRRLRVRATLPFFGPSPTLLGTVGAVIWIRSPIYSRKNLFDIGVSGPIAGFVTLLPFLVGGVFLSRVNPGAEPSISFGTPLLLRVIEMICFPGVAPQSIALHPMTIAAWAGLLATAMNLLPIGQLDGGHILYAIMGPRVHAVVSASAVSALAILGFVYKPWWIWALFMFLFRRHQLIYDELPIGRGRLLVGCGAGLLLILSFCIVPVNIR